MNDKPLKTREKNCESNIEISWLWNLLRVNFMICI